MYLSSHTENVNDPLVGPSALRTSSTGPPVLLDKTQGTCPRIRKMSMTHSLVHLPSALIGGRSKERSVRSLRDVCSRSSRRRAAAARSMTAARPPRLPQKEEEEEPSGVQQAGDKAAAAPTKVARARGPPPSGSRDRTAAACVVVVRRVAARASRTVPVRPPQGRRKGKRKVVCGYFEREGVGRGAKR
jgi:hypothetical protein